MRYLLALLFLLLGSNSFSQTPRNAQSIRDSGIEAFGNNDLPKALALLDSWLQAHPDDGEIYLYRARIWEQFRDYSRADIDFTAHLQFFPENGEVFLERGRVRFQNGLFELARQDFESFLKLPRGETSRVIYRKSPSDHGYSQIFTAQTPNPAQAFYHLGLCHIELKEFPEALVYLDSAILHQPDEADFYSEKGKALALMGQKAEAKNAYDKALALKPEHFLTRQRLVFLTETPDDNSLEDLTQSIAASPQNPEPFKQRGYYRLKRKDPSGAKEDFLQALSMNPEDAQLWFYLGTCWVALKNYRESETAFGRALEIDPRNPEFLLHRGQSRFRMNEFQLALADFTLLTFYDPENASGFYHKGITLHRISGAKSACPDLWKAMNLGMPEAEAAWKKICGEN